MKKVLCLIAVIILAVPFVGAQGRDIAGSDVVYVSHTENSPTDVDVVFLATQVTSNIEYFDRVTINLPAPWTVVSVTAPDFSATGGTGTGQATASDDGYPCSGFGVNCDGGCIITVKINPNGNMDPGVPVTWMIEGDAWQDSPPTVLCSTSDPCSHDACYDAWTPDQTGLDIDMVPVPVELMTFSIE